MKSMNTLMSYLDIKDVSTDKQKTNGTKVYSLPFYVNGNLVTIASYKSGYVRIDRNNDRIYQINPTYQVPYKVIGRDGVLRTWTNKKRIMIFGEQVRMNFILEYAVKNYFNKYKKWETIR